MNSDRAVYYKPGKVLLMLVAIFFSTHKNILKLYYFQDASYHQFTSYIWQVYPDRWEQQQQGHQYLHAKFRNCS